MAGVNAMDMVDDMGLAMIVIEGGMPRATEEAADLLRLGSDWSEDDLVKMFGLDVDASASNPIARAVRAGCAVSDRMVIADGRNESRLVEVTTLPARENGAVVILVRELADARKAARVERTVLTMPERRTQRGMTPRARELFARAAAR